MALPLNNIIPITLAVVLVFLAIIYHHMILVPRRNARLAHLTALERFDAEMDRIEALPKLNTQWLMSVPNHLMDNSPLKRSYGTRYNRILIIDEYGAGWVGLVIPEIIESLIAGEYLWHDFNIPFRGPGERLFGEPVVVDGLKIDMYPQWMCDGLNPAEWHLWRRIEERYLYHSKQMDWNYQSGLGTLNDHMNDFREKRGNFNKLAAAVHWK